MPTPDRIEVALEVQGGGGLHEVVADLVPRERHRTPALRPGVRRLLVARSGRHASLRFQEGGRRCASARRGRQLVQRAAAAAGGDDGKAHEILVPPREPQVHAAVPADAEQLVTARAAPFRVRGGEGPGRAGPARRGRLAAGEGESASWCSSDDGAPRLAGRIGDGQTPQKEIKWRWAPRRAPRSPDAGNKDTDC